MLRNFNETARYVDQGGGKRKGSFAMYLEPWHADVFEFLELRKNHGKEEQRARDLFYGLWIPDLFMRRVKEDGEWTLFCPNEAYDQETGKGLIDVWGDDFDAMYVRLEKEQKGRKTVKAQQLWFRILESQMKLEHHTCYTKTKRTENQISRTLGRYIARTCAPKSSSIPRPTKSQYAIWHQSPSRHLRRPMVIPMTSMACTM
jgi:hypothetical protein